MTFEAADKDGARSLAGSSMRKNKAKRILIVDDDRDFRWILERALETLAERVTTARDGCEAIERIKTERYDAVVMDMHMPCKDGLATLHEIRKTNQEMEIFILTLAPTLKMIQDVYLEHANGFFVKPILPDEIEAFVERLTAQIRRVTEDRCPQKEEEESCPKRGYSRRYGLGSHGRIDQEVTMR
jgi:two-component system response regulator MprA